jgi:FkbM family methyltransferase
MSDLRSWNSKFDIWTDPDSGLSYLISPTLKKEDRPDFKLIDWCHQFLSKDTCFIDIGAHIGSYSIHLSLHCQRVYSFEPQRLIYNALSGGIAINGLTNIHTYNIALGSSSCERKRVPLYIHSKNGLRTSMVDKNEGKLRMTDEGTQIENVMIYTLDSLQLKRIGFIKLSVGGSELGILKGAVNTLRLSNWPTIMFTSDNVGPIVNYLKELGYTVASVSGYSDQYLAFTGK